MQFPEPWNSVLKLKQTQSGFSRYCLFVQKHVISCSSMLGSREISVVLRRRPCTGWGVKSLGSQHRNMFLVQVSEALSTMIEITLKCQYVTPPFKFSHYKYTFFGSDMFVCVCMLSRFSRVLLFATVRLLYPWGFSRQEYRSGLPFPDTLTDLLLSCMILQVLLISNAELFIETLKSADPWSYSSNPPKTKLLSDKSIVRILYFSREGRRSLHRTP